MKHRPGALAAIGNTPVAKLSSFAGDDAADVWVKLEAANPTGSYKDRMALAMIEPAESAVIAGQPAGSHMIEGGGVGFVPPLITPDSYDRLDAVSTEDAFATARTLARTEGVWTGPSGGASILAATRLARKLGPGHTVVTLQPDSGLKYLSGDLYS